MRALLTFSIVILLVFLGVFGEGDITGNVVYSSKPDLIVEEAKAEYVIKEDLNAGETVLVLSPPIPILLSTIRFFEKYKIKNRITIELDNEREIAEESEKNNKLVKWYYMQEWSEPEEKIVEPETS